MQNQLTEAARKLSIPDRITLVEEIWDTIAEENQAFELTDAQKRELDRRLESKRVNPGQGRNGFYESSLIPTSIRSFTKV